jgi:hypothetical protein
MHRCQHSYKKFLQIYESFAKDPTVSKEFPTLASPRLYLDIFFQIYAEYWPSSQIIDYAEKSLLAQTLQLISLDANSQNATRTFIQNFFSLNFLKTIGIQKTFLKRIGKNQKIQEENY